MSDDMIETFLEETMENLEVLEEGFIELEKSPEDKEWVDSVFRAMHTIKGGAGLMGFEAISEIAHHLENVLDQIREGSSSYSDEVANAMFRGYDLLKQMVSDGDLEGSTVQGKMNDLKELISDLSLELNEGTISTTNCADNPSEKNNFYKLELNFQPDIFETGTDPLMLIYELEEVGEILQVFSKTETVPELRELDPHQFHLSWTIFLKSTESVEAIKNVFIFVLDENDIQIADITSKAHEWFKGDRGTKELLITNGTLTSQYIEGALEKLKNVGMMLEEAGILQLQKDSSLQKETSSNTKLKSSNSSNTIRVETEKLENILNHLAELLIAQSRVKSLVTTGVQNGKKEQQREVLNAFEEVDKIIRIVQEEVMNTSMIPIGATFMRFQRMVRDLALEKEKEIELVLNGKETDLDKKVIEQITDPLKHLVRNAVDHGIELPEERVAKGKPRQGTIDLNAFHQEGSIVIEIIDDGKGIDEEAVYEKALQKNLISPEDQLTSEEINLLLFKPGFSTVNTVTDISGRGVGLDVVMTNIKNLRGVVNVYSEKDKGTTINIKLPLTLAIIDGMMVRIGDERFIVPLNFILEFIKAEEQQVLKVEGKETIIHLRNEYVPYTGLHKILNVETDIKKPTDGILIIIKNNGRKMAVLVDEILGQEQVVIKSIKENMEQTEGIAGATILGDGNVALILDIPTLFNVSTKKNEKVAYGK